MQLSIDARISDEKQAKNATLSIGTDVGWMSNRPEKNRYTVVKHLYVNIDKKEKIENSQINVYSFQGENLNLYFCSPEDGC